MGEGDDKCICDYLKKRDRLIELDKGFAIGCQIKLTEREQVVNEYLMKHKNKEMDKAFSSPHRFPPANHFFKMREKIEKSKVFKFLKAMPKGSSLHSHDTGMVSSDYLYSLTYKPNLYARIDGQELLFNFFNPKKVPKNEDWTLVSQLRENDPEFEDLLKSHLTLIRDDPDLEYPDVGTVWKSFQKLFINLEKLLTYKPIFQEYFYQVLKELYEDNIRYIEFRGYLPNVYDLDGKIWRNGDVVCLYWETLSLFCCEHPEFIGGKFIYAPHRLVDSDAMDEYVKVYKSIKERFPQFVIGFDLVGEEDLGAPLLNFIGQFFEMKDYGCEFFFHAGETHWNGQPTDWNLVDAIMLGSVRIGHAFGLLKHPLLASLAKKRGIGIEISPISNQVLKLIDDVRDHPGAIMIANNFPVVVVNDDPSFWGGKGLTYDWYMTFMGMCHRDADLKLLKQLALNSIQYSAMDQKQKETAFKQFDCDWDKFLIRVMRGCECGVSYADCGT